MLDLTKILSGLKKQNELLPRTESPMDIQPTPTFASSAPQIPSLPPTEAAPSFQQPQSAYDQKRAAYEQALADPAHKQSPWAQGAFLALQGLGKVADSMQGVKNDAPIQLLGNAKKALRVQNALGEYAPLEAMRQQDQAYKGREIQQGNILADNRRATDDLRRKTEKDAETIKYWNRKADQGDLKLANEADLIELRNKWAISKDENDKRRLSLVEKEMENRNLRLDKTLGSRERVAGMKEGGANRRQQITIAAQKEAQAVRLAEQSGNQQEAAAARERLLKLKQEYESGN
jgi:hypothetical protein